MLHPDLLQTCIAVAESRSFTLAAQRLGLQQSTVSQHVKRVEDALGSKFFARDTHVVALTPEGDALVAFARQVLEANGRLDRFFAGSELRGHLRFGASEDFVQGGLEDVLAVFGQRHSSVDLELTVGLSGMLYQRFDAGELDVIFVKQRAGDRRGKLAWRERLAWVGRDGIRPDPDQPLPLILYPPPSVARALAIDALERAGRTWRVTCTSSSLNGLVAAARAGLGVTPHSVRLIPPGLVRLPPSRFLPELGEIAFVVIAPGGADTPAAALTRLILGVGL